LADASHGIPAIGSEKQTGAIPCRQEIRVMTMDRIIMDTVERTPGQCMEHLETSGIIRRGASRLSSSWLASAPASIGVGLPIPNEVVGVFFFAGDLRVFWSSGLLVFWILWIMGRMGCGERPIHLGGRDSARCSCDWWTDVGSDARVVFKRDP
jgi:hypothetical protein